MGLSGADRSKNFSTGWTLGERPGWYLMGLLDMSGHSLGTLGSPGAPLPFAVLLVATPLMNCLHVALQTTSPCCLIGTKCAVKDHWLLMLALDVFFHGVSSRCAIITFCAIKCHGESCVFVLLLLMCYVIVCDLKFVWCPKVKLFCYLYEVHIVKKFITIPMLLLPSPLIGDIF